MKLTVGTRRSPLALWQARHVAALLAEREPGLEVELVEIVTRGDKLLDVPLAKVGGKGLFIKEIEERLLEGQVDLAVHSLKDLPAELPAGLVLAAVPPREDPRDALVSARVRRFDELPRGARVGTSSLRRACQLKHLRPDLTIVPIRGNVQTRLAAVDRELDAGVLAVAGLVRLGLAGRIAETFDPGRLIPAVGQGALAVEARRGDERVLARLLPLESPEARRAVSAERGFLRALGGGCQVPVAAHAEARGSRLVLRGMVGHPGGSPLLRFCEEGEPRSPAEAEEVGRRGAEAVLAQGARAILDQVIASGCAPES